MLGTHGLDQPHFARGGRYQVPPWLSARCCLCPRRLAPGTPQPPKHPLISCISRDNVLVRHGSAADHTDHSLQAHAGPTDLDVAMFHRDAGGGGGPSQGGGKQRISPQFSTFLPQTGSSSWGGLPAGSLPFCSYPCSKLAPRPRSQPPLRSHTQDSPSPLPPKPLLGLLPSDLPASRCRL